MAKRWVMFTFPEEIISEPVIHNISQQFNLITNIRQAEITEERGWIILEIEGKDEDIEAGLTWVISRGVRVDPVGDVI